MKSIFLALLLVSFSAFAAPKSVRWTGAEDTNPDLMHVLSVIKAKTGIDLGFADFMPLEDRNLATSHFTTLIQVSNGIPIKGQSIRIWTSLTTGESIQVEARIDAAPATNFLLWSKLSSEATMAAVRRVVLAHADDAHLRQVDWQDQVDGESYVRLVKVKAKHGTFTIKLANSTGQVLDSQYREFPQADETSLPVRIYPIYEEPEGSEGGVKILERIDSELRYLNTKVRRPVDDPYASLRSAKYVSDMYDPLLGLTTAGRKSGYWSPVFLKNLAAQLLSQVPLSDNNFANGVFLEGRYATVSLYPDAPDRFKPLAFTPTSSGHYLPFWKPVAGTNQEEMIPTAALRGRPITSLDDALMRPARRLKDNDPVTYINDGFDEIQVYWSITQMFETLRANGFTDPELSTRPFHAFLFDPDISYRDNAFYTDDTINFTTYSPMSQNMARDNSTIWHELGHGVMDRLMGDHVTLADTGGLSEGMADFVAQLVLNDVSGGSPYEGKENLRIFNSMGFGLTNEVHDDGESYGGAMNDLLRAAMARHGRLGLVKVTDLTLEAMRLTRNHPALTASDWFEHMIFADELGRPGVRASGEMRGLILQSLNGRNFVFGDAVPATFTLKNGANEVTSTGPGSRNNPIQLKLDPAEKADYALTVNLKSSPAYHFKYPVTVQVELKKGPLQGAIHWTEEDKNPLSFTLNTEADTVAIPLSAVGKCDEINRPDGSCVDFAYVKIFNSGTKAAPQAKKRFYLRIYPKPAPAPAAAPTPAPVPTRR